MKRWIKYFMVPLHLAAAIAAASAAALAAAYIGQYGFGLKPCVLCLYQRIPYALNISLGIMAILATFRYPRLATLLLWLSAMSFLAGASLAGFHVGVEQKWWAGLSSCGGNALPENVSLEDLRRAIIHQGIVRCDTPAWLLFGVSMAGYNFALSLALGLAVVCLLRENKS